ncbi:hypothetical protein ACFL0L_02205 [Patescibacteria group bacterium]
MGTVFTDLEHLRWFLRGHLFKARTDDILSPADIPDFRDMMLAILVEVIDGLVSLEKLLTVLPSDMRIGQSKCTPDNLIPVIRALMSAGGALPAYLRWQLDLGQDDGETHAETGSQNVWDEVRTLIPGDKDVFFSALQRFKPSTDMNWGTAVPSFQSAFSSLTRFTHPIDLLEKALPHWDGKSEIAQSDVQITSEGLPPLLSKFIIPGLTELIAQLQSS